VEQSKMDPRERIENLRRNKFLIVAALVGTTLGALAFSTRGREAYTASSRVVLRPVLVEGTQTPQDAFDALQDPFGLSATIETQVELALGQDVAERVSRMVPRAMMEAASVSAEATTAEILAFEVSATDPDTAVRVANAYPAAFLEARRDLVHDAFIQAASDTQLRIDALTQQADELEAVLAGRASRPTSVGLEAELRDIAESRARLVTQFWQLEIDAETVSGGGAVVQPARSASTSGPAPVRDAAVGVVLGLALGLGLAVLRSNSDRRLFTLDAAADATGVEVLAAIPRPSRVEPAATRVLLYGSNGRSLERGKATSEGPPMSELGFSSVVASSLSILREALVVRGLGSQLKCLVVLSPEPDEGSALVAAGLSWACAQAGLRTIVVDGAVGLGEREPLFGTRGPDGVGRVLAQKEEVSDALLQTSIPGLRVLPAGPPRHRHDDALASVRPQMMVEALGRRADVIVVRAPAVSSGGDATAWATAADAILLVVRAGTTRPGAASRASGSLRSLGLPLIGTVLTASSGRSGTVGLPGSSTSFDEGPHARGDDYLPGAAWNGSSHTPEGSYSEDPGRQASARGAQRRTG
jgi:Mrp family chromosome partitioning ATPase/capsular polysaccharide biosynthesis protein